ncbi:nitrogenase component 1 [Methanosarcina sp. UBA5]|uniref:nitrogenase component 1 n=1 Tax=Methanosarcina sp. UBA5 TaxID=1915593 RepID=UPI0025E70302|nr:nitrogenase component 1 [Methanosarcina sp. UBA5]
MSKIIETPRYSCALGGALSTIMAIEGSVPIIHSGPGCGVQLFYGQSFTGGFRGSGWIGGVSVPSTNTYEKEVVFGGEKRLKEQIESTIELIEGDRYVVLAGCTAELIGDDVKGVLRNFKDKPVIYAETAGFKGSSYIGYEILLDAFIDQVVEERLKEERLVNILGIVPSQDVFWEGSLAEIERILNSIGLEVNTLFNEKKIEDLSSAALNIVLSPWVGVKAAEILKKRFGTPYIVNPLPIGVTETNSFLEKVGAILGIDVSDITAKEEKKTYKSIEKVADFVTDFDVQLRFVTITDSNYAIALNKFLVNEFGWIPSLALITDDVPEDYKDSIKKELSFKNNLSPEVVFESDSGKIWDSVKKEAPNFIFGSSLDKDLAAKLGATKLSVSFPFTDRIVIDRGYAGYRGAVSLLEDALSAFVAPL